jgi:hypothetical protein
MVVAIIVVSGLLDFVEKYNYKYAMSFWFYLDSFAQSTSSANHKLHNILSYGDNPCVKYDIPFTISTTPVGSANPTMSITVLYQASFN